VTEPTIDVAAVMATSDKKAATQAKKVFTHLRVAGKALQFTKLYEKSLTGEGKSFVDAAGGLSLVLLDVDMPDISADELIARLRATTPEVSMVIVASDGDDALQAMRAGAQDYILKPIRAKDLLTLIRLLEERRAKASKTEFPKVDAALPHLVERLHDPSNGQLDARKVAEFFGLTVAEIARLLGRGVSTVHKTPAAPMLQETLRRFEAMASGLLRLTGSERRARMWLNASDPALEGHAPIEWLRMGKLNDLGSYIQDQLEGRPA
jgi:DNA-binding NarL/FixJ family response regulator